MRINRGQFIKGCKKSNNWYLVMKKRKGKNHPMWKEKNSEIVFCGCGCGELMDRYDKRNRERFRIIGHQMKGRKQSDYQRERMTGQNNPRWNPNRTLMIEKHRIRGTQEWKNWRMEVFERDKYTCQECGESGVYLEPHHINPIRDVDLDSKKLFELTNGITLCRPCHQKTIWKESSFEEKYLKIVAQV